MEIFILCLTKQCSKFSLSSLCHGRVPKKNMNRLGRTSVYLIELSGSVSSSKQFRHDLALAYESGCWLSRLPRVMMHWLDAKRSSSLKKFGYGCMSIARLDPMSTSAISMRMSMFGGPEQLLL